MFNFNSLIELLTHFKDEETCLEYFAQIRWNGNPTCPHCNHEKPYKIKTGYKCSNSKCYKKFSVRYGTIFYRTNIPMRIWFAAMYLLINHKKGISSVQLGLDLNVSQGTAWFMMHRIRLMMREEHSTPLGNNNPVEVDETYIGGKEKNRHMDKKRNKSNKSLSNNGSLYNKKKVVIGAIERESGKVRIKHIRKAKKVYANDFLKNNVIAGANLYTDESKIYKKANKRYTHKTIIHSIGQYVDGDVYTNCIENFWSCLKRGLNGIYHSISEKHLERYLDEYAARYNTINLDPHDRIEYFLQNSERTLSYKELTEAA